MTSGVGSRGASDGRPPASEAHMSTPLVSEDAQGVSTIPFGNNDWTLVSTIGSKVLYYTHGPPLAKYS
eukprot:1985924-Pyramimonas_sp.AAC.1